MASEAVSLLLRKAWSLFFVRLDLKCQILDLCKASKFVIPFTQKISLSRSSLGSHRLGRKAVKTSKTPFNNDQPSDWQFFYVMLVTMPIFQDGSQGFLVARVLPQDTPLSPMPSFTGNTVAVDRAAGRWSFRRFTLRSRDIQTIPFSLLRIKLAAI